MHFKREFYPLLSFNKFITHVCKQQGERDTLNVTDGEENKTKKKQKKEREREGEEEKARTKTNRDQSNENWLDS